MFLLLAVIGITLFWIIYPKSNATPNPHVTARKWLAWATLASIVTHPGSHMFMTSNPQSEYIAVIVLRLIIFLPTAYGIGYVIGKIKSKNESSAESSEAMASKDSTGIKKYMPHALAVGMLIVVVSFSFFGVTKSNKWQGYSCKSNLDVFDCENKCEKLDALIEVEFIANVQKQTVAQKSTNGVRFLEGCKVLDEDNWECGSSDSTALSVSGNRMVLSNGEKYTDQSYFYTTYTEASIDRGSCMFRQ